MTHPAMSPDQGPGHTCRVCGAEMDEGSLRCGHCGATYGERNRCPHCGTIADIEPHAALRYRCRVCGGPRVPLADDSLEPSGAEWPQLKKAQSARMRVAAWRVAAGVVGAFGALSLFVALLTLAFISPGVLGTSLLLMAVAVPFILTAIAWSRARRHVKQRDEALDRAWLSAAGDVMRRTDKELDARGLAGVLRIDEDQAEQLLARLDVENVVRARVDDSGELQYSAAAGQKLRVQHQAGSEEEETSEPEEGHDVARRAKQQD